ncbi:GNAT family N-acetyltransferase [Microbacterium sp.]|uniref:GNAT family N-acetyltransferase n=1 Tax=Microbacterium sp. TaxID=51671 RepID=UPI0039E4268C
MTDEIEVRVLSTVEAVHEAAALFDVIWPGEHETMPANILRALEHSGNYVAGVYDGDLMVGAAAAFCGPPAARTMHSHIAGVLPEYQGRGVGKVLKNHQREWAFARGIGHITWTFDPLVARNAHFNLRVLGARVTEYLVDQYGPMDDGINRGDESDRLMISWALAAPAAPPREEDIVTAVAVPHDIEALRRTDPLEAGEWRYRVRDAFQGLLADGFVVGGFDDDRGYLFVRR